MLLHPRNNQAFTLIEISIVLVVIGLLVGGVLVGRDLLSAAAVRAQISQIESYQTAVNTFRSKYDYLPGDIKDPEATSFGLKPRGTLRGQGDGNGVLESYNAGEGTFPGQGSWIQGEGENAMLWVDLSSARLIDQAFSTACSVACLGGFNVTAATTPSIASYLPRAATGNGNYVYAYSGGVDAGNPNKNSYFGLSGVFRMRFYGTYQGLGIDSTPALTVKQAAAVDSKIDDGLPQGGRVQAYYMDWRVPWNPGFIAWSAGGGNYGASGTQPALLPTTVATPPSSTTCYDNGGVAGNAQAYSIIQNSGLSLNCGLSIRFQ
jgi:prepilin-type N-terminal cleavage/methylation domain-containing protein